MFNISLFESLIILLVGIIFIGPKEIPTVISFIKKIIIQIKSVTDSVKSSISEIDVVQDIKNDVNEVDSSIKEIVDLDGNIQKVYDISNLMPEIKVNEVDEIKKDNNKEKNIRES